MLNFKIKSLIFVILATLPVYTSVSLAQSQTGTIFICTILVDTNGNVFSGGNMGTTFVIPPSGKSDPSFPDPVGSFTQRTFATPLLLNATILRSSSGNDSQCVSQSNLPLGTYYYGRETLSGTNTNRWDTYYNDQFSVQVQSLADFYAYDVNNGNSDGLITLLTNGDVRTLVVLNKVKPPTPTAAPASVSIKCNGINPCSIPYNGTAMISWTSVNTTSCTVSPGGWTGTSGSQVTPALPATRAYSVSCNSPAGTVTASVTVNVGPPPTPAPAPTISNVKIINITSSGATVTWTTDKQSDSQLEYCLTAGKCNIFTSVDTNQVTSHSVDLSGLKLNTYYYVWVRSKSPDSQLAILGYYLFKTLSSATPTPTPVPTLRPTVTPTPLPTLRPTPTPKPVPVPPVISNVQVSNIGRNSATISWNTDKPSTSLAVACLSITACFGSWQLDGNLVVAHSLTVSKLNLKTNYSVLVISKDDQNNYGYSFVSNLFTTLPGTVISNPVLNSTSTSITATWNTDYPATSMLVICKFLYFCYLGATVSDTNLVLSHSLTSTKVSPNTNYYYYVISIDDLGYFLDKTGSVATQP